MLRIVMVILWSSFLAAIVAEGLFFSFFDPIEWPRGDWNLVWSPIATYTVGFFFFWGCCTISATFTWYLLHTPALQTPPP